MKKSTSIITLGNRKNKMISRLFTGKEIWNEKEVIESLLFIFFLEKYINNPCKIYV